MPTSVYHGLIWFSCNAIIMNQSFWVHAEHWNINLLMLFNSHTYQWANECGRWSGFLFCFCWTLEKNLCKPEVQFSAVHEYEELSFCYFSGKITRMVCRQVLKYSCLLIATSTRCPLTWLDSPVMTKDCKNCGP
jgi:hypothetical protein